MVGATGGGKAASTPAAGARVAAMYSLGSPASGRGPGPAGLASAAAALAAAAAIVEPEPEPAEPAPAGAASAGRTPGIRASQRPSPARAAAAARASGATRQAAASAAAVAARTLPSIPGSPRDGRHLKVVEAPARTPAQRRRRARAALLGIGGLIAVIAFGLVYLHVELAQRQFALDRVTSQVQKDQATYQSLRLQVAELGSPQHIISTAEGKLGMVQPAKVTYVTPSTVVAPGGGATRPAGAAAATAGASGSGATAGASGSGTTAGASGSGASAGHLGQAPAGDADWPQIKSQLAGSP
ncbi:MAG: hypothetical protein ACRDYY_14840 [Acidimicrobiales bacterium]